MTIQAIQNRLLIQEVPQSNATIVVPDAIQNPLSYWKVLSRGKTVTEEIAVGDFVLIVPGCNIYGVHDKERIGLVDASAIVAVVKPETPELN